MIEGSQCIANTLTTTFALGIMSVGSLLGEICIIDAK
jgi:hypothetical protein